MKRNTVSGIMLTLLLAGVLVLMFDTQPVKASGTIYIRPDGSIDPPSAPISSFDNIIYTFAGNVYDSIVIERNHITVNGSGYTIHGTGNGEGITLYGRNNVTITNLEVTGFQYGITLEESSKNTIYGNNITGCDFTGVIFTYSHNNTMFDNTITKNEYGIWIEESKYNTISRNNIVDHEQTAINPTFADHNTIFRNSIRNCNNGVSLGYADYNVISENKITESAHGIQVDGKSSNNRMSENNITNSEYGINWGGTGSIISANVVTNNTYGLYVGGFSVKVSQNIMNNNKYNLVVWGEDLTSHSIDVSNLVDGNPVYYITNEKELSISPETYPKIGYLGLVNCSNVRIEHLTLENNGQGILLAYTNNSRIKDNTITNNDRGIHLESSSNNIIYINNITNNRDGILVRNSDNTIVSWNNITDNDQGLRVLDSSYNRFYQNNFLGNTLQLYGPKYGSIGFGNIWDCGYSVGGNYWSDYEGVDTDGDGFGDTPYILYWEKWLGEQDNITDNYPLTSQYSLQLNRSDLTPPTTTHNYDGKWHADVFTVNLMPTDDLSELLETYYRINDSPTKIVRVDGQPLITTEGLNAIEYWSIDKGANEEIPHRVLEEIKLDKTSPVADGGSDQEVVVNTRISLDASGSSDNIKIVSYEWDFGDGQNATGITTSHTYTQVGTYTLTLTVADASGRSDMDTVTITVHEESGDSIWIVIIGVGVAIVALITAIYFTRKR